MIIEDNEIYCMDCVEGMKQMQKESVDLVITSPPYDNLRNYETFEFNIEAVVEQLYRIIKNGGVVVWIVNDATINGSETGTSFRQALCFKKIGFGLHDTMIWYRRTLPQNSNRYEPAFEYMFVFSKGSPKTFNPIKSKRLYDDRRKSKKFHRNKDGEFSENEFEQQGDVVIGNVWDIPNRGHKDGAYEHPAIFPEKLVEGHILSWSNNGDLVLDPFNGSGTTTKIAKYRGRRFVGFDVSDKYCMIARERLKQTRLFEVDEK